MYINIYIYIQIYTYMEEREEVGALVDRRAQAFWHGASREYFWQGPTHFILGPL